MDAFILAYKYDKGCIRKLRQLTCCLAALSGNDLRQRFCTEAPRKTEFGQRNGLMIYNNIERVLVITKLILLQHWFLARNNTKSAKSLLEIYIYTQTNHQTQLSDAIFIF